MGEWITGYVTSGTSSNTLTWTTPYNNAPTNEPKKETDRTWLNRRVQEMVKKSGIYT